MKVEREYRSIQAIMKVQRKYWPIQTIMKVERKIMKANRKCLKK
jgi:hypothetical protein